MEELNTQIDEAQQDVIELTARYKAGDINSSKWKEEVAAVIAVLYISSWLIGRNQETLNQQERALIENLVNEQVEFLTQFASELDNLSTPEINRRLKLYLNSSRQALERSKVYGIADLPAYPCDGTSNCLGNCKCRWEIEVSDYYLLAYWRLGKSDHCAVCLQREKEWNPYIVRLSNESRN